MTVLDIPLRDLERHQDRLTRAIEAETRFGVGAEFKRPRELRLDPWLGWEMYDPMLLAALFMKETTSLSLLMTFVVSP